MRKTIIGLMALALVGCTNTKQPTNETNNTVEEVERTNAETDTTGTDTTEEGTMAAGTTAPDFSLPTIDGKQLALSDLRGKYVIIDFWGSWCGWCIKGMPEMKKYYEKYGSKLEILGVDCGDTEEAWKEAVNTHQLTCKHLRNGECVNDITGIYEVQGFPTKVLVDPEGKIVKYIVGEDPAFYTTLDEVLKN